MRYMGSIVAFKGSKFNHCTVMVEANSLDEATGKVLRVATETQYPKIEGYSNHSISCDELSKLEIGLIKVLKSNKRIGE